MKKSEGRNPKTGKFLRGNPGRPPGVPNKVTGRLKQILENNAEELASVLVQKALDGDMGAMKIIFSRLLPPVTKQKLDIPPGALQQVESTEDYSKLVQDTFQLVIDGHLTPREAAEILDLGKALKMEIESRQLDHIFKI